MIEIQKRIAIISDIHIGPSARAKDLSPSPQPDDRRDPQFLDRFKAFVRKENVAADVLIVAGDITSKARHSEFMHASSIVLQVADCLGVSRDRIFYVPGNHDVNWETLRRQGDANDRAFYWARRYDEITGAENIFVERLRDGEANLFDEPYACIWQSDVGLIVSINSAWHDAPDAEVHHGNARDATLAWIDEALAGLATPPEALRILVVHHHPIQYSDPFPDVPELADFSIIQNAERLLSLLRTHKFDLLVHGHKHVPRFQTHLVESDYPVQLLGAGSFCVELPSSFAGQVLNQFHLLTVDGRLPQSNRIVGLLRNWSYAGSAGWQESLKRFSGIDHICGFGYFATKEEFKATLFAELDRRLVVGTPVRYADLVATNAGYAYMPGHTISESLSEYASEKGIALLGSNPREFILLKELP